MSMETNNKSAGFFIAPFGADGEQVGSAFREYAKLSERWLQVCSDYLEDHGGNFDAPWQRTLSHLRTKFTSASGAAIVTFYVKEDIAASFLLLSGQSEAVERDVSQMFVESLRKTDLVKAAAVSQRPFESILMVKDRPLMVVVPWGKVTISEDDHNLVKELGLHLAGAFFLRQVNP